MVISRRPQVSAARLLGHVLLHYRPADEGLLAQPAVPSTSLHAATSYLATLLSSIDGAVQLEASRVVLEVRRRRRLGVMGTGLLGLRSRV